MSMKDLSPNLLIYMLDILEIDEKTDLTHIRICQSDLLLCQLKMDSKFGLTQNAVINRNHSDNCDFCGESLILEQSNMDSSVLDPISGCMEDHEVKEFLPHKHFGTSDGYVADKSISFVKFALSCVHSKTMNKPKLTSCVCKSCYIILLRKYQASTKNIYYTPSAKRQEKEQKSECCIPSCTNKMIKNTAVIPEFFITLFNFECGPRAALCAAHRLTYINKLSRDKRCLLCSKLLKYCSSKDKIKPKKETKAKVVKEIVEKNLDYILPEDFVDKEYEFHRNCHRTWTSNIERSQHKYQTPSKRSSAEERRSNMKRRRLFEPAFDEINIAAPTNNNESMDNDDIMTDEGASMYNYLEETTVFIHEEAKDIEVSRGTLMKKIDKEIVDFLLAYIQDKKYITRKKIAEKYQDSLRTQCILNNMSTLDAASMKGDRMQRRLLDELSQRELTTEIQFSFLSNKGGYLIHEKGFDFKKEVLKLSEEHVFEDLDSMESANVPAVLHQYQQLSTAIKESGETIDEYYRKQKRILDDFDLNKFFSLIKPAVFNFVVLTTMSTRETRQVMNHPNLPLWLNGEDYLLETYNPEKINSQRLFSKRIFLCLGKHTKTKGNKY